jgi:hypothetical protein
LERGRSHLVGRGRRLVVVKRLDRSAHSSWLHRGTNRPTAGRWDELFDRYLDQRAIGDHGVHVVSIPRPSDMSQYLPPLPFVGDDAGGRRKIG